MATEAVELSRFDVPQAVSERNPRVEGYVRSLTPIFEDPRVYVFLETLGKTVARRRQETKVSGHISLGSAVHDVQKTLGWPDADIAQMKGRYDEIVLLFLPEFQRRAKSKARKMGGDFDEWQSIAAEELTARVAYFDWKPFQTDPSKAVDRFLGSAQASLQDPSLQVYDTKKLEEREGAREAIDQSNSVESQVIEKEENDQIETLIEKYLAPMRAASEKEREVLRLRIMEDKSYEEIGKITGMPRGTASSIVGRFRKALPKHLDKETRKPKHRSLSKELKSAIEQHISFKDRSSNEENVLRLRLIDNLSFSAIRKKLGVSNYCVSHTLEKFRRSLPGSPKITQGWAEIIDRAEKYRKLYDAKKYMLTPYFQEILDLFFQYNTGERNSTITAIHKALETKGRNVSWDSIRRHVLHGMHILDNRERHDKGIWGALEKHNRREVISKVYRDEVFLASLPPRRRRVIELYIGIISQGKQPFLTSIAKVLGVNESTISRDLDIVVRKYLRALKSGHNQNMAVDWSKVESSS